MNRQLVRVLVVFIAVLVGSAFLVYFLLERSSNTAPPAATTTATTSRSATGNNQSNTNDTTSDTGVEPQNNNNGNHSVLNELFGIDRDPKSREENDKVVVAARVLLRFIIAAFLAMLLAFRWRKGESLLKRNPYVAQTQILLGVVAAAMMMIVGDSAARAFGIFAAASLVRFRTNIRDPKETTVLLICLGVGLACGVGRLDMALILTLFVLLALWVLEHFESTQIFRSMEMRIETRNLERTRQVLNRLFEKHSCNAELRLLERQDSEGEMGKIVYELSLGYAVTTDQLSEEILAEDAENVAGLEWEQKKSSTYIYN